MAYEAGWKRIDERTFAVRSNILVMSEAGLRLAVCQIPKDLRRDLLQWQWKRQYQDERGRRWLEFYAI